MKVSLSENAWHYRLQKFVYANPGKIESLCPYFWKTAWALVILPIAFVGSFTRRALDPEGDHRSYWSPPRKSNTELGINLGMILLALCAALFIVSVAVMGLAALAFSPIGAILFTGILLALALVIGAYKSSDLWIPFTKSVKNKVCPMINWKE